MVQVILYYCQSSVSIHTRMSGWRDDWWWTPRGWSSKEALTANERFNIINIIGQGWVR